MKTLRPVALISTLFTFLSGYSMATDTGADVILHVNSYRIPCVGMAPMSCLQVRRDGDPADAWSNFYTQIHGFDFEFGYVQKLRVRETRLPPETVPADASSIRYDLVEVIEKVHDTRLRLHDIWALVRLDGLEVGQFDPASRDEWPRLEFNIPRGEYYGNDGCKEITGQMLQLGETTLRLRPESDVTGQPGCGDGLLQAQFSAALLRVHEWRRDRLTLSLLDIAGSEVLVLRKVD